MNKPEAVKRKKSGSGVAASVIPKKRSGGEKRKSKIDDATDNSLNSDKEGSEQKGKKGKTKKEHKLSGGGRKKSSTKLSVEVEHKLELTSKASEIIPKSSESSMSMSTNKVLLGDIEHGVEKKSKKKPQKIRSKPHHGKDKRRGVADNGELTPKDLELIERAKTCYEEANKIWKMAWEIICERFYIKHGPKIAVHELRDTWRRLIQEQWMDEDFRQGNFLPEKVLIADAPSLPLGLDLWARGAIEVLPDAKRESVMDPFIRDLDNFLSISSETKRRRTRTKSNRSVSTLKKSLALESIEEKERKKSVRLAHSRRKTLFEGSSMASGLTVPGTKDSSPDTAEKLAAESRTQPSSIDHNLSSEGSLSRKTPANSDMLGVTSYMNMHDGIFGNYADLWEKEIDLEDERSKFKPELNVDDIPKPNIPDSRQNEVTDEEPGKKIHMLHTSSQFSSQDEQEEEILTASPFSKTPERRPIISRSSSETIKDDRESLHSNEEGVTTEHQFERPPQILTTGGTEPLKSDSSVHNYSSILQETDTPVMTNRSKHLLIVEPTERERQVPKSTLSADRIENFFASMIRTNSKDSLFAQNNNVTNAGHASPNDSEETGSEYSDDSMTSFESYENLTDIDRKAVLDHIIKGDESDSPESINSSSSSFQSSFSSDSEKAFQP